MRKIGGKVSSNYGSDVPSTRPAKPQKSVEELPQQDTTKHAESEKKLATGKKAENEMSSQLIRSQLNRGGEVSSGKQVITLDGKEYSKTLLGHGAMGEVHLLANTSDKNDLLVLKTVKGQGTAPKGVQEEFDNAKKNLKEFGGTDGFKKASEKIKEFNEEYKEVMAMLKEEGEDLEGIEDEMISEFAKKFNLTEGQVKDLYPALKKGSIEGDPRQIAEKFIGNLEPRFQKAEKQLHKAKLQDTRGKVSHEIKMHQNANGHPNVVGFKGTTKVGNVDGMVMEYVGGGDLKKALADLRTLYDNGRINHSQYWGAVQVTMRDMLSGLAHLEKQGIVHSDIKPENALLSKDGVVKIADFGVSDLQGKKLTKGFTPAWSAPEQGWGSSLSSKMDVWAAGQIVHETGEKQRHDVWGEAPILPGAKAETAYVKLVRKLLASEIDDRWSASEALENSEFLKDPILQDEQAREVLKLMLELRKE